MLFKTSFNYRAKVLNININFFDAILLNYDYGKQDNSNG